MSSGRYFRGLTAYDVLGNIIPGAIGLIVLMGFLSSPPVPNTVGQYVLFIAIAFTVGAILQAHASKAIGQRESFDKTMDSVEELPSLQYIQDDSDQEDNSETESDTKHDSEIADASTESGTSKKDSTNWLAGMSPVYWPSLWVETTSTRRQTRRCYFGQSDLDTPCR